MNIIKSLALSVVVGTALIFSANSADAGCGRSFVRRDVVIEQVVVPVRQQVIRFVEVPDIVVERVVVNRNRAFVRSVRNRVFVERRTVRRRGLLGFRREVVVERFLAR